MCTHVLVYNFLRKRRISHNLHGHVLTRVMSYEQIVHTDDEICKGKTRESAATPCSGARINILGDCTTTTQHKALKYLNGIQMLDLEFASYLQVLESTVDVTNNKSVSIFLSDHGSGGFTDRTVNPHEV